MATPQPTLRAVLESAARFQRVVPDEVLVGGAAAALYAGHRDSFDHDHMLRDLSARFDAVLDAVEATDGWVTNRVVPAERIGTSASRLSTYATGRVAPSSTLLVRMERLAAAHDRRTDEA